MGPLLRDLKFTGKLKKYREVVVFGVFDVLINE